MNGGKMYEMLRCYTGIAKLYQITHKSIYLKVIVKEWEEISKFHQNAAGAPCGGAGIHWECYNLRVYVYTLFP